MELQIGTVSAITLAKEYATPLYVYDKQIILKRIQELKDAFPNAHICYAIKANPNHSILKLIAQQGLGVDCSNRFELELAEKAGFDLKKSVSLGVLIKKDHISIGKRMKKIPFQKKYPSVLIQVSAKENFQRLMLE